MVLVPFWIPWRPSRLQKMFHFLIELFLGALLAPIWIKIRPDINKNYILKALSKNTLKKTSFKVENLPFEIDKSSLFNVLPFQITLFAYQQSVEKMTFNIIMLEKFLEPKSTQGAR
jgi:hypothetical protein